VCVLDVGKFVCVMCVSISHTDTYRHACPRAGTPGGIQRRVIMFKPRKAMLRCSSGPAWLASLLAGGGGAG
jgi:hypothetical protein